MILSAVYLERRKKTLKNRRVFSLVYSTATTKCLEELFMALRFAMNPVLSVTLFLPFEIWNNILEL